MRTGLVGEKVGMTRVFDEAGQHVPLTLIHIDHAQVVGQKTGSQHGYTAIQVGIGQAKPSRVTRPLKGVFAKVGVEPKKKVVEFRVDEENLVDVGAELQVDHFTPGQFVDVTGISIGKGFAGAMKRHNFGGLPASHGVSISHRSHGSIGNRTYPGRVFKNKKMAGHLGHERVTIQNLRVVFVDVARGLIAVQGAIPGHKGGYVLVRDAIKKPRAERSEG